MGKRVKEFIEVKGQNGLDDLIARLVEIRNNLPQGTEADVKLRGDDVFGRHIAISYMRPQTAEEAECDARYMDAYRESRERELSRLQDELGFCTVERRGGRKLRIVA